MANHQAVDPIGELTKNREFVGIQVLERPLNHWQLVMRIDRSGGVTGKMLAATRDALRPQCIVEGAGQPHDLHDIATVATAT